MKYLAYNPTDEEYTNCKTLEEARACCKDDFLQEGAYHPDTDCFLIYTLEETVEVDVIAKKEDFTDEEWQDEGYSSDHEEIWEHKFIKDA